MPLWILVGLVAVAALLLGAVIASLVTRRKDIDKVAYMMDALEDGELNFRFLENNRFNRTLNRIRTIFERQRTAHEQDSWEKLIRVLTHEIMNTVAPIASLSDALAKSVDDEGRSELDLRAGLDTISDSSKNLIKFVETYRALSGVAHPVRKTIQLSALVERVVALHSEHLAVAGATCCCEGIASDLSVYVDDGQVSQILINLLKNALQAGAKRITLTARRTPGDDVVLTVANDGAPISRECQEQIFVPFFTTKPAGSGIGLSISRQIMRQHNGSIELLKSDPHETVFLLTFR